MSEQRKLTQDTPLGKLCVEPWGDSDNIEFAVYLVRPDGAEVQVCVAGVGVEGKELRTFVHNGDDEEPTKYITNPWGEYATA